MSRGKVVFSVRAAYQCVSVNGYLFKPAPEWVRFYLCGNGTKPVVRRYPGCDTGCGVLALQLFKVHFSYALYCEAECFGVTLVSLSLSLFVDNSERKTCQR